MAPEEPLAGLTSFEILLDLDIRFREQACHLQIRDVEQRVRRRTKVRSGITPGKFQVDLL